MTGADEDGEIETECNVELIGEALRVTEAVEEPETETVTKRRLLEHAPDETAFPGKNEVKVCTFHVSEMKFYV